MQFEMEDVRKPEIQIVVDDSFESRLLVGEIQGDRPQPWLDLRKSIRADIKIYRYDDPYNRKIPDLPTYPRYRFKLEGEFEEFPKGTFACQLWPLQTLAVLTNRYELPNDEIRHKRELRRLRKEQDDQWTQVLRNFVLERDTWSFYHNLDTRLRYPLPSYYVGTYYIEQAVERRYGYLPDKPEINEPKKFELLLPWEKYDKWDFTKKPR